MVTDMTGGHYRFSSGDGQVFLSYTEIGVIILVSVNLFSNPAVFI